MKSNLLIIDNNPDFLDIIFEHLDSSLWEATLCEKTSEVEKFILSEEVDVLLMDIMMPEKNGIHTYLEYAESLSSVPVIFMSGYMEESKLHIIQQLGAFNAYEKPLDYDRLTQSLLRALELRKILQSRKLTIKNYLLNEHSLSLGEAFVEELLFEAL